MRNYDFSLTKVVRAAKLVFFLSTVYWGRVHGRYCRAHRSDLRKSTTLFPAKQNRAESDKLIS